MSIKIANKRAIVNRQNLIARLDALLAETPAADARPQVLALVGDALAHGHAEMRRRLEAGVNGEVVTAGLSYLMDQILRFLFDYIVKHIYPVTNPTKSEQLALVAVGGYGRGELAPFSDIDLLFLMPYKQTPWGEQVSEYILYFLWDLGLTVGHAARSIDDCMRLARADFTIRTSLLEARYLWGRKELYNEFHDRFWSEVATNTGSEFVDAKLAERDQRHRRLGDSRYVVEPNLKDGKGGLRDLHTLYWIAKYLYRVKNPLSLVDKRVLTLSEHRRLVKAKRFLLTVRCHLHWLTGRGEERLTFDVQPTLSKQLHYADRPAASSVERFMKHYYLVAKDIGDLTRIFCAHLDAQQARTRQLRLPRLGFKRAIAGFTMDRDRLTVAHADIFKRDPANMLRLFHMAQEHALDIHPEALRLVTRGLALIDNTLREDPEANRLFLEILTSRKDPETTLRRLNEAGVLGRFVPDFGRVVAQTQHDMYHVYTVDEHTIRAIGVLSRIESGAFADEHPLSTRLMQDLHSRPHSRRTLYMAVLLHDIAKGRGGDHSILGAEIAEALCPRVGLNEAETETVAWLVRHHLLMSKYAFKRDIADPKTVADFTATVQSPERLRLLLVLTVADIRAVGPTIWNGWKGQLLRELYHAAEAVLDGGLAIRHGGQRAAAMRDTLRQRLADWSAEEIDAYQDRHYDAYWLSAQPDTLERDARLIRAADAEGRKLALDWQADAFRAITELTLYAEDHPGLFARVAGALALAGASIADAKIITTKDGMALDRFWIQDVDDEAFADRDKLEGLATDIRRALAGEVDLAAALRKRRSQPHRTDVFQVSPRVLIDNKASETFTLIEINGRDRPGLLYRLTHTLFTANASIGSAHVATYGERAVDVFYVRDLFGHKITHPDRLQAIEAKLLQTLGDGDIASEAAE